MLLRTHLTIALFFILLLIQLVPNPILFMLMAVVGTIFPDIDSKYSYLGKKIVFRPIQFFVKHRGIFHSLLLGLFLSIGLYFIMPALSYGFFLGFALHLLSDSFTKEGTVMFWPIKKRFSLFIKTGSRTEDAIFIVLFLIDFGIFLYIILN